MDGELLQWLYHELFRDRKLATARRCTYSDAIILFIHFQTALTRPKNDIPKSFD